MSDAINTNGSSGNSGMVIVDICALSGGLKKMLLGISEVFGSLASDFPVLGAGEGEPGDFPERARSGRGEEKKSNTDVNVKGVKGNAGSVGKDSGDAVPGERDNTGETKLRQRGIQDASDVGVVDAHNAGMDGSDNNRDDLPVKESTAEKESAAEKDADSGQKSTPGEKETAPEKPKSSVTSDDITRIIVKKIEQNRSNSGKIGDLLKVYGVAKVSELKESQYEAFLTDISQL